MPRQQREHLIDGVAYVRHRGKLCPLYPLALHVEPRAYPTDDPLWTRFVEFVGRGGVVRADLLDMRDDDWQIVWRTFKAGAGS